jgi:tRNA (adenine57-N1/adenine58-N1)-methyltransferase
LEQSFGKVFTFEYHEPRFEFLKKELNEHGLDDIVLPTHRDVYADGFSNPGTSLDQKPSPEAEQASLPQPYADTVFLDLPCPWLALPHLTRNSTPDRPSPLNPNSSIYICTFSPCIEQAQRTASALRTSGWLDIRVFVIANRQIMVRRDRISLRNDPQRGVIQAPASVDEALDRLLELEGKTRTYHDRQAKLKKEQDQAREAKTTDMEQDTDMTGTKDEGIETGKDDEALRKQASVRGQKAQLAAQSKQPSKTFKEGRLTHRTESDLKTHTSFLLFAVLPRGWTAEDEAKCEDQWPLPEEKSDDNGLLDTRASTAANGDSNPDETH